MGFKDFVRKSLEENITVGDTVRIPSKLPNVFDHLGEEGTVLKMFNNTVSVKFKDGSVSQFRLNDLEKENQ